MRLLLAVVQLTGAASTVAALAGLMRDWRLSEATTLGRLAEQVGAARLEMLVLLADWPAWPMLLFLGGGLLVLAGVAGRRRPRHDRAPAGPARATAAAAEAPAQPARPSWRFGQAATGDEIGGIVRGFTAALAGVALFSGISNVLMLTGSFFMLEVYDRVLPSRSLPTLIGIAMLAGLLFLAQALIDIVRGRILTRIGTGLDEALSARVFDTVVRLPLRGGAKADGQQPIRDLDMLRGFLSGNGPAALFDLPWMPLYLLIIYLFHPVLGLTALIGVVVLVCVTLLTEVMSAGPTRTATEHGMRRADAAESARRNAEVLAAMGMAHAIGRRWAGYNRDYVAAQQRVGDVIGGFGSVSRVFRMLLQSTVLGVGAWLVIGGEASAGIIIAGSILASRALAPVEMAIANWRGFVGARQSWRRLSRLLRMLPAGSEPMPLPAPTSSLSVEAVSGMAPGEQRLIVQDISFTLTAGQGLAIMGPSASGKSTLARLLVGVWLPVRGSVRLDGASLDQWSSSALGRHIGYLPQDVELFAGTIAQNISRFDPDASPDAVVSAAKAAGAHELIVGLKDGYETEIGEQGRGLSAGQQQRVALARALYGEPMLVVLDEPNSNLDAEGDAALTDAIGRTRARGGIVIVVAHRPSAIVGLNLVLALRGGRQQIFGPKDEVLAKILRPAPAAMPRASIPGKVAG